MACGNISMSFVDFHTVLARLLSALKWPTDCSQLNQKLIDCRCTCLARRLISVINKHKTSHNQTTVAQSDDPRKWTEETKRSKKEGEADDEKKDDNAEDDGGSDSIQPSE